MPRGHDVVRWRTLFAQIYIKYTVKGETDSRISKTRLGQRGVYLLRPQRARVFSFLPPSNHQNQTLNSNRSSLTHFSHLPYRKTYGRSPFFFLFFFRVFFYR
ncbi:hypothetical protein L1887_10864 [Cichorium endivia]|nr:hypothetical protein L1887_10864 [Cichorium endivia]